MLATTVMTWPLGSAGQTGVLQQGSLGSSSRMQRESKLSKIRHLQQRDTGVSRTGGASKLRVEDQSVSFTQQDVHALSLLEMTLF